MTAAPLVLGRYQLIKRIAMGGMGEIYLARQQGVAGFERLAILKSLLPSLATEPGLVEQFLDEARVAAQLNHPNVVAVYEVDVWEGVHFIAMEYIEGESLSQIIKAAARAGARIPFPITAKMIHDAAMGLAHAHAATRPDGTSLHVIHRDVSPQNIMVRLDGVTKVVDFGIARATGRTTTTNAGTIKGKVQYMAPEVASSRPIDARSDQFCLGIVLWELCTRKGLFRGDTDTAVLRKVLDEPIPRPRDVEPSVPAELEAIIMRMLERDPERRYPDCLEVTHALRDYLAEHSRQATEHAVGELVQQLVGAQVRERARDVKPSNSELLRVLTERADPTVVGAEPPRVAPAGASEDWAPRAIGELDEPTAGDHPQPMGIEITNTEANAQGPGAENTQHRVVPKRSAARRRRRARLIGIGGALAAALLLWALLGPDGGPAEPLDLAGAPPSPATQPGVAQGPTDPPAAPSAPSLSPAGVPPSTGAENLPVDVELGPDGPPSGALEGSRAGPGARQRVKGGRPPARDRAAAEAGQGFLTLHTVPWTEVSLDGRPLGPTPLFRIQVAVGVHDVELVNAGAGVRARRKVMIRPGELTKINVDLSKD